MDPDTRAPGPNEARRHGLAFRQHPRWLVFFAGVLGLVVVTPPMALGDPEYRAAFFWSVNPLGSLKFVVLTTLFVVAWITFIPGTLRIWRSAWNFEILPDRLIATHQLSRRRHEIPWTSITAVTKLRPSPFLGSSRRQFSRIVLADGTDLLFNPLLERYSEFVDELRRRVTCQIFDPYPELIR